MRETGGMVLSVLGAEWLFLGQVEPILPVLAGLATGAGILVWHRYQQHSRKD